MSQNPKQNVDPDLSEKRRQAGRKGGAAMVEKYGREHFSKIGKISRKRHKERKQENHAKIDIDNPEDNR